MTDEMAQNLLVLEKLHSYFLICFLVMTAVGSIIILLALIYLFRSNYRHSKSNGKISISETKNRLPDDLTREEFLLKSTNKTIRMKTEQHSQIMDK